VCKSADAKKKTAKHQPKVQLSHQSVKYVCAT